MKKSILISLCGHLALFGFLSFSFGERFLDAGHSRVHFLGPVLDDFDFLKKAPRADMKSSIKIRDGEMIKPLLARLKHNPDNAEVMKPPLKTDFAENKKKSFDEIFLSPGINPQRKPVVMLYPRLPYHFNIYFRDRDSAHIELRFKALRLGKTDSVLIQRKISSGNLEVDLLSMRYISHYLFIQRMKPGHNDWHTVKIDFSTKND